ncbi:hypothetical protein AB4305_30725 [Nocardia sp. 2YAB30]|uniref:hypothetical protein n=1 Tax=Nocardia sp. 2YAB30 TaxID=3233022 RepID=UPI003F9BBFA6
MATEKKDIVIGVAGGYGWDLIRVWALSLLESGFKGPCVVILYDDNEHNDVVARMLQSIGFHVVGMPRRGNLVSDRFADVSEVLGMIVRFLRYAIVTDIRDIYFQSDPMVWLENRLTKPFLAVSEALRYRDETWNRNNLCSGFPAHAARILPKPVCNIGVLAGEAPTIADLCLAISVIARSSSVAVADQSAYNLMLDMEPYRSAVQIVNSEDGFVCQAQRSADPRPGQASRALLLEPGPILDADGVKTASGKLYPIVHQYDRVPEWNKALLRILASKKASASNRD